MGATHSSLIAQRLLAHNELLRARGRWAPRGSGHSYKAPAPDDPLAARFGRFIDAALGITELGAALRARRRQHSAHAAPPRNPPHSPGTRPAASPSRPPPTPSPTRDDTTTRRDPSIPMETLGLGRSPACCAGDGPPRGWTAPFSVQLERLAEAEAAVDEHFSYPHETPAFVLHARPRIVRLLYSMGATPRTATVRAVHATLLRTMHPQRIDPTDDAVCRAMQVPTANFRRWKQALSQLRRQADDPPPPSPEHHADDGGAPSCHGDAAAGNSSSHDELAALDASGTLLLFAAGPQAGPSAPPSPPDSSSGDERPTAASPPHDPPHRRRPHACKFSLCGGGSPLDYVAVFRCLRLEEETFACIACGACFRSVGLELAYQKASPRAGFPPARGTPP